MEEKNKLNEFKKIIGLSGFANSGYGVGISLLYLDYISKHLNENKDVELEKTAKDTLEEFVSPFKKSLSVKELLDNVDSLQLSKDEYKVIASSILDSNSAFDYSFSSSEELSMLVNGILDIKSDDIVFDLGSGYGKYLASANDAGKDKYFKPVLIGQEANLQVCLYSKMYLEMCGANYHIENTNSIQEGKCPQFTKGFVFPPFGMKFSPNTTSLYNRRKNGEVFNLRSSSEWLFVFRALDGLAPNGKIVAIVTESCLFKSSDSEIRRYLINEGLLEGIISLPANMFAWTGVKTDLLVISKGNSKIKILDATSVMKEPKQKTLTESDSKLILSAYCFKDIKTVTEKDILSSDCNLIINALSQKGIYDDLDNPVKLSDVVDIIKGSQFTLSHFNNVLSDVPTGYQLLTSGNIDNGLIDYNSLLYVEGNPKFDKFCLEQNDLVVTSKSTKVKIAVASDELKTSIVVTGGMYILRPKKKLINSVFLKMFLDSSKGKKILESIQKGAIISSIPFEGLANIMVPCPSLSEQEEMATKYSSLIAIYDGMKKGLNDMEKQIANFYDDSKEVR